MRRYASMFLLAVIAAGISFRLAGLEWGIPSAIPPVATPYRASYHFDEDNYLQGVARIQPSAGEYDVVDYHWGTLQFYLIWGALRAAVSVGYLSTPWQRALQLWDPVQFPRIFAIARGVSAAAGILTLFVLFLIGRQCRDAETGLAAAALLAISPLHVVNSHFLTSDVTMLFLAMSGFYCFLRSGEGRSWGWRLVSGLLLGLAIASKYNAVTFLPALLVWDLFRRHISWSRKTGLFLAIGAGFSIGEPYFWVHTREVVNMIYQTRIAATPIAQAFAPGWSRLLFDQANALVHYGLGWTVALPAAIGLVACVMNRFKNGIWICITSALLAASLIGGRWAMIRYALPLLPFLLLVAALALAASRLRDSWQTALYALVISVPLAMSWSQVRVLLQEHPANAAARWIEHQAPPGSRIGLIWPELPILDQHRNQLHPMHGLFGFDKEDAQDLDRQYLIIDNLPIHPFQNSFSRRLAREYTPVADFHLEPKIFNFTWPEQDAPHDWKYTHPQIRIYKKR